MRTLCSQFIESVVQLIIEPDISSRDTLSILNHLMKLESLWSVAGYLHLDEKWYIRVPIPTGLLCSIFDDGSKLRCGSIDESLPEKPPS